MLSETLGLRPRRERTGRLRKRSLLCIAKVVLSHIRPMAIVGLFCRTVRGADGRGLMKMRNLGLVDE
jgi:hypothetical protein